MKKLKQNKSVLILGAGVAGLACGYELVKAGYVVTVVERESQVGGLASTIEKNGFRFDTGPHRWYAKNDEINNWMINFMKDELIKVPRLTRIYFDKHFFNYPIKLDTIRAINPVKGLMAALDYVFQVCKNLKNKQNPKTLEDGYTYKFGNTLYQLFFKRYTEKLWGRKCDQISSDWIDQRTRGFDGLSVVKEILIKKKNVVSFVDEFFYPKKGIGRIAEKMAEEIKKSGGKVILNSTVLKINRSNKNISSIEIKQNGKIKKFKAGEYVSSIPLPYLVSNFHPSLPQNIVQQANNLKFRSEVQVVLFLKKTKLTPDTWIYVHPSDISFVRMMEMDNWSSSMQPKNTTAYLFEVPCEFNDQTWKMNDKKIVEQVIEEFINEFHLVTKDDILGSHVHRIENLLPVYHVGYQKPLSLVKSHLKKIANLQIIGRNGVFRYNNTDHSIEMGFYAARNIIFGDKNSYDIDSVNISREYLEEKRLRASGEYFEEKK